LIGKKGQVTKEIVPGDITGKVRIENDMWSATGTKRIPIGATVIVKESQGVHITVEEIKIV